MSDDVGVLIANDELYLHAGDLSDLFSALSADARQYLDNEAADGFDTAQQIVVDLALDCERSEFQAPATNDLHSSQILEGAP